MQTSMQQNAAQFGLEHMTLDALTILSTEAVQVARLNHAHTIKAKHFNLTNRG